MSPKMEFFKNAQNFTMGDVQFNTTQGDYYDNSTRNVRNTYGDRNRYYTNNKNRYYNNSTNYNGDYHAPATHYHGPVNNVGPAKNVISGGFVNQGEMRDYNQFDGPVPHPDDPYPPGPPPAQDRRPGPRPYDQHFTATQSAVPQHEGFPQRRGPPPPNLPHRPESDDEVYQWGQQQQGPPPAFPPMGSQGYPQHPPQDPSYRPPMGAPSGPPQQRRQPPPQQQWQGPEEWPGQHAYNRGMAKLRNNSPDSWDMPGSGDSDSSDDSDSDEEMNRGVQRMEDPNRRNYARGPPQQWQQQPQRGQPPRGREDGTGANDTLSGSSAEKGKKRRENRDPVN